MNVFFLDPDPYVAARAHNDKHVVKMPLETAQILSTVYHQCGIPAPYLPTHSKHPCTLWAARSRSNYAWLVRLGFALCEEYYARFGHRRHREHASAQVIRALREPPASLPEFGLTEPAQALPEPLRVPTDAVAAYRAYYRANKAHIATWTLPGLRPDWFDQPMELASC